MHTLPSNFWQWLSSTGMGSGRQADIVAFGMFAFASVVVLMALIVSVTVYKVHRNRLNDGLKRKLLERGMSAEEIVDVIRATPTRRYERRDL